MPEAGGAQGIMSFSNPEAWRKAPMELEITPLRRGEAIWSASDFACCSMFWKELDAKGDCCSQGDTPSYSELWCIQDFH